MSDVQAAPDVEAINVADRLALLTDGRVVPITNLLDADGDETSDTAAAVGFVAGATGQWFAARIADYETTGPVQ